MCPHQEIRGCAKVVEGADPLPERTRAGLSEDVVFLFALSEGFCLQDLLGREQMHT